jgi:hypothetical protein
VILVAERDRRQGAALVVEAAVDDDAVEPGGELRAAEKPGEGGPYLDEGVLGDVFGVFVVAEHA